MKRLPVKLEIIIVIVIVLAAAAASSQTLWSATTVAALPAYQATTLASSDLINRKTWSRSLTNPKQSCWSISGDLNRLVRGRRRLSSIVGGSWHKARAVLQAC
jgi:type II secretory pathway pseudopilin PulG